MGDRPARKNKNAGGVLATPLRCLDGIGPALELRLAGRGWRTVGDLLYTLPRRYEDRRSLTPFQRLAAGQKVSVAGRVERVQSAFWRKYGRRSFEVELVDEAGARLKLKWFNVRENFFRGKVRKGTLLLASGTVRRYREALEIDHPDFETFTPEMAAAKTVGRIIPVYPEMAGLKPKVIRKLQAQALTLLAAAPEPPLPQPLRPATFPYLEPLAALSSLHAPEGENPGGAVADAARNLAYQEMLVYLAALGRRRLERQAADGFSHDAPGELRRRFLERLPFSLTADQWKAAEEILADLAAPRPMNRLLQGDVGCGKTAVAALAILQVMESGRQAALMAPTEILAEQHWRFFQPHFQALGLPLFLLTAGTPAESRRAAAAALAAGQTALAIGTQALLSQSVRFQKLGLAVVDEQHRFGVLQRRALRGKDGWPDTLVLSATPIPRSLALTVFGDTEVSRIETMPGGRQPVPSEIRQREQLADWIGAIRQRLERGERSFVVSPLIETNEELQVSGVLEWHQFLCQKHLPAAQVGLLHGGMSTANKEQVLRRFRDGAYGVLVATNLIEVGIDIPQATLMAILYPERFGLAQLHQLRGRVGRGERPGQCWLLASRDLPAEVRQRLELFRVSHNGFDLAEIDLRLRGGGTLAGTRQTGGHEFRLASLPRDVDLFIEAAQRVKSLLAVNPRLEGEEFLTLRQQIETFWAASIGLTEVA